MHASVFQRVSGTLIQSSDIQMQLFKIVNALKNFLFKLRSGKSFPSSRRFPNKEKSLELQRRRKSR